MLGGRHLLHIPLGYGSWFVQDKSTHIRCCKREERREIHERKFKSIYVNNLQNYFRWRCTVKTVCSGWVNSLTLQLLFFEILCKGHMLDILYEHTFINAMGALCVYSMLAMPRCCLTTKKGGEIQPK